MSSKHSSLVHNNFIQAPFDRRIYAFLLDFITIWFLSSFFKGITEIIVNKNKGQSLGCWAFDLKIISIRTRRIPQLNEMLKREATLGFLALLAMLGLKINFDNGLSMLLLTTPVVVDFSIVLGNQKHHSQTLHDMVGHTILIQSQRGFSLDLRIKKILKTIHKKYIKSLK